MKSLFQIIILLLLVTSCGDDDENPIVTFPPTIPIVQTDATYDVLMEEDVIYAQGLSHEDLNSAAYTTFDLKLDVYQPDNDSENRPAFLFIHGGGFSGGSKQQEQIITWANYYASRGWVFVSIDYRLKGNIGSVPQEWVDYTTNIPDNEDAAQFLAMYPANRDAKAAMRWLVANADTYNINTDYITVGGGSAGAITAITLGISDPEDFRDEISVSQDPSLATTHLDQSYEVKTIIDLWGSKIALDATELIYGHNRFDNNDPPLFIAHGTEDPTVLFSNAEDLKAIYDANNVPLAYYPFEGLGHGAWNSMLDGKRLEELAFDFIVEQQELIY